MSAGGWGCPHEVDGRCSKIRDLPCDPGMKGCELYGRYAFFDAGKNVRLNEKRARARVANAVDIADIADPAQAPAIPGDAPSSGDGE